MWLNLHGTVKKTSYVNYILGLKLSNGSICKSKPLVQPINKTDEFIIEIALCIKSERINRHYMIRNKINLGRVQLISCVFKSVDILDCISVNKINLLCTHYYEDKVATYPSDTFNYFNFSSISYFISENCDS